MRARVRARRAFLDLFADLYWRKLAVVVALVRSMGKARLFDFKFISNVWQKNVGVFPKNVGDFLKNVGDFPENVGDFLWKVRSEW